MEDILIGGGIFGILLALFLLFLAILWVLLPFAVFGTKDRLDKVSKQLEAISDQLQEMTTLLDPDEAKTKRHAEYLAQQEMAVFIAKERAEREKEHEKLEAQRQREAEKLERMAKKEEQKLAKTQATLNCPVCNKQVVLKDLRNGVRHECPHCHAKYEIT
jgi:biopolymer transport protein ExbB/TolQ